MNGCSRCTVLYINIGTRTVYSSPFGTYFDSKAAVCLPRTQNNTMCCTQAKCCVRISKASETRERKPKASASSHPATPTIHKPWPSFLPIIFTIKVMCYTKKKNERKKNRLSVNLILSKTFSISSSPYNMTKTLHPLAQHKKFKYKCIIII